MKDEIKRLEVEYEIRRIPLRFTQKDNIDGVNDGRKIGNVI